MRIVIMARGQVLTFYFFAIKSFKNIYNSLYIVCLRVQTVHTVYQTKCLFYQYHPFIRNIIFLAYNKKIKNQHSHQMEPEKLTIAPRVKIKQTYDYLSSFKRFSLIEKIEPRFFKTPQQASVEAARVIKNAIQQRNKQGKTFVLGLATGSTPLLLYKQLIRLHKEEGLSFKNVITFNLDEYFPIKHDDPESYNFYMWNNLFNYIDILKENVNIPDGEIERSQVTKFCENYQKKIALNGGIDLQILGIGRTGHIGFNEPPSPINSCTRLVYLHRVTRRDASKSFNGIDNVPKAAITMGINTINKAKKIIIMAWSENKADIVKRSIEGQVSNEIPSTFLHSHSDATFYMDKSASQKLQRFTHPWTIKGDTQDPIVPKSQYWILNSVVWLSKKMNKPILRLQYEDYEDNNLADLIVQCAHGKVENLNLYVYRKIGKKITAWPLQNKPREEFDESIVKVTNDPKKVLIFSPHPDDDVISMGGTLRKLVEQGNHVYVAYMTSGAGGVFDFDAQKYFYFLEDIFNSKMFEEKESANFTEFYQHFQDQTSCAEEYFNDPSTKKKNPKFAEYVTMIKRFIRSSEAKISVRDLGVPPCNVYNLNLPFYYTKSRTPGQEDDKIVLSLLRRLEPDFIYAAGDLSDPHGTHRVCLQIVKRLFDRQQQQKAKNALYSAIFPPAEHILLYRGAWQEWNVAMAKHIVPLSPKQVQTKTVSILKHQTQKDNPMFPGEDKRQFWERVKIRNKNTANTLKILGLPQYEAAQAFVDLNDLVDYDEL